MEVLKPSYQEALATDSTTEAISNDEGGEERIN